MCSGFEEGEESSAQASGAEAFANPCFQPRTRPWERSLNVGRQQADAAGRRKAWYDQRAGVTSKPLVGESQPTQLTHCTKGRLEITVRP